MAILADFTFDAYPFIIMAGVILALVIIDFYFRKKNLKKGMSTDYEILFTVAAGFGFIFAILFQNLYDFIEKGDKYQWTWAMTFFGGLIGGVVTFLIGQRLFLHKKYKNSMVPVSIICGGAIPLTHAIGRIACTIDGCCYGKVIEEGSPFYWMGIEFATTPGVKVYPTQLWEAIFLLILSTILIVVAFKKDTLITLPIYCIAYGIFRFLIEFVRGDHRGSFIPGLTPSQFWALLLLVGGVIYLAILIKNKKIYLKDWDIDYNTEVKEAK